MAKKICDSFKTNPDEDITTITLAGHLGVSRNTVHAVAAKFSLKKWDDRFRKYDVFRRIHGLEPMLLDTALASFKAAHSRSLENVTCDDDGQVCLVDELTDISDLTTVLWEQGLIHVSDLAAEYGYVRDTFRKKLKSGDVNLPPIQPIELSPNRVMYRPLDVVLWCRHGIVLNLPKVVGLSPGFIPSSSPELRNQPPCTLPSSEAMTTAVFATAVAATDKKSGFDTPNAHSPDGLHKPQQ